MAWINLPWPWTMTVWPAESESEQTTAKRRVWADHCQAESLSRPLPSGESEQTTATRRVWADHCQAESLSRPLPRGESEQTTATRSSLRHGTCLYGDAVNCCRASVGWQYWPGGIRVLSLLTVGSQDLVKCMMSEEKWILLWHINILTCMDTWVDVHAHRIKRYMRM